MYNYSAGWRLLPLIALLAGLFTAPGLRAQPLPVRIPVTDGLRWGYADTSGAVRIPLQWPFVQPFAGGRATVLISQLPGGRIVYASIDTGGRYVIPPEAGWTGEWRGSWAATPLNAFDSNRLGGLIDPEGRMLIAREWESAGYALPPPLQDSFKIVTRDGLSGIISRAGELVTPCKWGEIHTVDALAEARAVIVKDPDNLGGLNNLGIADLQGRIIVPPRYNELIPLRQPSGRLLIAAYQTAGNEIMGSANDMYASYREASAGRSRYVLDFPSGRKVPGPSADAVAAGGIEYRLPGGYITDYNKRFLMDSARRIIVPCCRFRRLSGDTLVLGDQKATGKDSLALHFEYRHIRTMAPLRPAVKYLVYIQPPEPYRAGSYPYSHHNTYERRPEFRIPDYGDVDGIYKDSLLWTVQQFADARKQYAIVSGSLAGKRRGYDGYYMAVLDSHFNYIIPPLAGLAIRKFDPGTGLAVAEGRFRGSDRSGQMLITAAGTELIRLPRGGFSSVFRWQGALYAFISVQDECNPEPSGLHHFIVDTAGIPLPAFSNYTLAIDENMRPDQWPSALDGAVWVYDSARRIGALYPDGTQALPALNFRYGYLRPAGSDWFLAGTAGAAGNRLLDREGRDLAPGMNVRQVTPVTAPRLFLVAVHDPSGQDRHFYIDYTGRLYYKPL